MKSDIRYDLCLCPWLLQWSWGAGRILCGGPGNSSCKGNITVVGDKPGFFMFAR
jgi:hypothetical protein